MLPRYPVFSLKPQKQHTHTYKQYYSVQTPPLLRPLKSTKNNSNMGLIRDFTSGRCGPPVIYLTTLLDPNTLAAAGTSTTPNANPLLPLFPISNNIKNDYGSSSSNTMTFQQQQQRHQHQHQQQQWSSSSSSMPQQEETDNAPAPGQGGKKKKKKKKKKANASTDPSLAPDEPAMPPATLLNINEQDDTLDKGPLDWVDGAVVLSDTNPTGKKSKARKKAAATVTTAAAEAEDSAETTTGQHSEEIGFKASQVHFEDEPKYAAQAPVNGGVNVGPSYDVYDMHGRQVLYSVVASSNDSLSFLDDDFMNTATSNWADDIDEYELKHVPPISIATAAQPTSTTTSLSTSVPQTLWKDSSSSTLVYKGTVATQVATSQSQDARFSSSLDTRRCHSHWESAPQSFKARPRKVSRDYSGRPPEYKQPRSSREYPARPFECHQRSYGEYSVRPSDNHQRPPTRYQLGMPHRPPMSGPLTHSHPGSMTGRPPFQHQTYYPGRPQQQHPHFERAMRLPGPQHASQQQQQHQHQHQRPSTSSVPDFGPTPAPVSFKKPKAGNKSDKKSDQKADNNVNINVNKNVDIAWQSLITTKPDNAWPSLIAAKSENARHPSTKPAWATRRGSYEGQGSAESQHKPEVEMNKRATAGARKTTYSQSSGYLENKRVTKPEMDARTSLQPQSQCQKDRHKKQEQHRRFSLSIQSQDEPHMQTPMQMEAQVYDQRLDQQLQEGSESEQLQELQQILFYDTLPLFEDIKDFELPWMTSWKVKTGPEPWADRNKVIEFFSKRWVDARMSSGGRCSDAAVVYCSSP